MASVMLTTRIDKKTKVRAANVLKAMGLNISEAVNIFLRQVVYTGSIPFELKVPSRTAMETMKKIDAEIGLREVSSTEELFRELKK